MKPVCVLVFFLAAAFACLDPSGDANGTTEALLELCDLKSLRDSTGVTHFDAQDYEAYHGALKNAMPGLHLIGQDPSLDAYKQDIADLVEFDMWHFVLGELVGLFSGDEDVHEDSIQDFFVNVRRKYQRILYEDLSDGGRNYDYLRRMLNLDGLLRYSVCNTLDQIYELVSVPYYRITSEDTDERQAFTVDRVVADLRRELALNTPTGSTTSAETYIRWLERRPSDGDVARGLSELVDVINVFERDALSGNFTANIDREQSMATCCYRECNKVPVLCATDRTVLAVGPFKRLHLGCFKDMLIEERQVLYPGFNKHRLSLVNYAQLIDHFEAQVKKAIQQDVEVLREALNMGQIQAGIPEDRWYSLPSQKNGALGNENTALEVLLFAPLGLYDYPKHIKALIDCTYSSQSLLGRLVYPLIDEVALSQPTAVPTLASGYGGAIFKAYLAGSVVDAARRYYNAARDQRVAIESNTTNTLEERILQTGPAPLRMAKMKAYNRIVTQMMHLASYLRGCKAAFGEELAPGLCGNRRAEKAREDAKAVQAARDGREHVVDEEDRECDFCLEEETVANPFVRPPCECFHMKRHLQCHREKLVLDSLCCTRCSHRYFPDGILRGLYALEDPTRFNTKNPIKVAKKIIAEEMLVLGILGLAGWGDVQSVWDGLLERDLANELGPVFEEIKRALNQIHEAAFADAEEESQFFRKFIVATLGSRINGIIGGFGFLEGLPSGGPFADHFEFAEAVRGFLQAVPAAD